MFKLITTKELRDKILNNEDISDIDYSHITDMSHMFYGCSVLKEVPEFNTSIVKTNYGIFKDCSLLKEIS